MNLSRRQFLWTSGAATAAFCGFRSYVEGGRPDLRAKGFGDLVDDPKGMLNLPPGFSYIAFSRTGESMDDGFLVPGAHDGMAAFPGPNGRTILVRNHELDAYDYSKGAFGPDNVLFRNHPVPLYDPGRATRPGLGGTTTLVYDTKARKLERHFLSLAGTWLNCAGGATPWGTWISCEETVQRADGAIEKDHGYAFEVPASAEIAVASPVPLAAMGRFRREAVAVDPKSGIVYHTEDQTFGLFYRFIPNEPGKLSRGGRLQALKFRGRGPQTSNRAGGLPIAAGETLDVEWIDLERVESPDTDLAAQGHSKGAAVFDRNDGIIRGSDGFYFCSTTGGAKSLGQVWRYQPDPGPGRLQLFIEPNQPTLLRNGDNLTVAPWGDLIVCEDYVGLGVNRVVGITAGGRLYTLAMNVLNLSEFAGAAFSPDGSTLFVNLQRPGLTLAITGPWENHS